MRFLMRLLNTNGVGPLTLARQTLNHVLCEHGLLTRASAIAFSSMMAFIPFLALVLSACVYLLPDLSGGPNASPGILNLSVEQLEATLHQLVPDEAYLIVADQLARIQSQPPLPVVSISLLLAMWTSSGLFLEIIDALNRIYGIKESRSFIKLRFLAFFMTIVQALILLTSMCAIVAWPQIIGAFGLTYEQAWIATAVKWVVVFLMIMLSFGLTFHVGPDAMQSRKWVTPGALFGTTVFLLMTYLFKLYVQNWTSYENAFGSLGGVLMLMFWFWISSLVLLVAAEMNKIAQMASDRHYEIRAEDLLANTDCQADGSESKKDNKDDASGKDKP